MPQGSGRTLCGDRARCGVEMNRDTHIRSETREIDERSGSGATPRVDRWRSVPCAVYVSAHYGSARARVVKQSTCAVPVYTIWRSTVSTISDSWVSGAILLFRDSKRTRVRLRAVSKPPHHGDCVKTTPRTGCTPRPPRLWACS